MNVDLNQAQLDVIVRAFDYVLSKPDEIDFSMASFSSLPYYFSDDEEHFLETYSDHIRTQEEVLPNFYEEAIIKRVSSYS